MVASVFVILFQPLVFIGIVIKSQLSRLRYMKGKSLIETTLDEYSENESTRNVFKYYFQGILPQFMLFILLTQQFSLLIMGIEASQNSFYPTKSYLFLTLRYMLITVTYYMFAKDYKSLA